jgi:Rho GTPase-activating protein 39
VHPNESRNSAVVIVTPDRSSFRRSRSFNDYDPPRITTTPPANENRNTPQFSSRSANHPPSPTESKTQIRRSTSTDHPHMQSGAVRFQHLPPIPGSPDVTDVPPPSPSPPSNHSSGHSSHKNPESHYDGDGNSSVGGGSNTDRVLRTRAKSSPYVQHRSPPPQSLGAAVKAFTGSDNQCVSDSGHSSIRDHSINGTDDSSLLGHVRFQDNNLPSTPSQDRNNWEPPSSRRPIPPAPVGHFWRSTSTPVLSGREIGRPVLNHGQSTHLFTELL